METTFDEEMDDIEMMDIEDIPMLPTNGLFAFHHLIRSQV